MAAAGGIAVLGDGLVQRIEKGPNFLEEFDAARSLRCVTYRAVQAPLLVWAWGRFDVLALALRLSGWRSVAFKVGLDQALVCPTCTTSWFVSQSLMEGRGLGEAMARLKVAFWPTYFAHLQFGTPIHTVTFSGFMPVHLRIVWSSSTAVLWTAYLSYANQAAIKSEAVISPKESGDVSKNGGVSIRSRESGSYLG